MANAFSWGHKCHWQGCHATERSERLCRRQPPPAAAAASHTPPAYAAGRRRCGAQAVARSAVQQAVRWRQRRSAGRQAWGSTMFCQVVRGARHAPHAARSFTPSPVRGSCARQCFPMEAAATCRFPVSATLRTNGENEWPVSGQPLSLKVSLREERQEESQEGPLTHTHYHWPHTSRISVTEQKVGRRERGRGRKVGRRLDEERCVRETWKNVTE